MASNFQSLKKSRTSSLNKLLEETQRLQDGGQSSGGADDRFWQPQVDKAGNGYAVIRFLPEPKGEDLPFVRMFNHAFKGPSGKWFIENCPTTLGGDHKCPVCEHNSELWNSGVESDKAIVRDQKRKLQYISNILVIKDPSNPDNEGKVFLYRYGKKIWDKLNEAMNPAFEDESPINPFDFWEGADFKLKIRNLEGYRNYDKSEFDSQSELFDGDDEMLEKAYESLFSLQEFVDLKNFKPYNDLKDRLNQTINAARPAPTVAVAEDETLPWDSPSEAPSPKIATQKSSSEVEEDDDMSFFEKLANDD